MRERIKRETKEEAEMFLAVYIATIAAALGTPFLLHARPFAAARAKVIYGREVK